LIVTNRPEKIEAGSQITLKEIGLGKSNINGLGLRADGNTKPQVLPPSEKVPLADLKIGRNIFGCRETSADAELAGRFLLYIHINDRSVCGCPLFLRDFYSLEEIKA